MVVVVGCRSATFSKSVQSIRVNHQILRRIIHSRHLYWRSQFFGGLPLEKLCECMEDGRIQSQKSSDQRSAKEKRRGDVQRGASMTPRTPLERHPHSILTDDGRGLKLIRFVSDSLNKFSKADPIHVSLVNRFVSRMSTKAPRPTIKLPFARLEDRGAGKPSRTLVKVLRKIQICRPFAKR